MVQGDEMRRMFGIGDGTLGNTAISLGLIAGLLLVLGASGCGEDDDPPASDPVETAPPTTASTPAHATDTTTTEAPAAVVVAEVTGPIDSVNGPIVPQPAVPAPAHYIEEEFFVAGDATRYETEGDTGPDGFWTARPVDTAAYQTRVLVRRPPAEDFSGVVIVEWLNVTTTEASPDWAYLADEVTREGHAYVAASIQALGVIGGESLIPVEIDEAAAVAAGSDPSAADTGGLVNADPDRYGSLQHPGDAYAYDIFSQVGAAMTAASDTVLGGLEPTTVIALGESQSAGFLTTYLNAVHPLVDVYDGFLVHSRGAGGAALNGGFAEEDEGDASSFVSDGTRIRTDLDTPVFMLQTETDLTLLGFTLARQPDTDTIRTWEVAGTAHADAHVIRAIIGGPRDATVGSFLGCTAPINTGPHHEVAQAALHHLVGWAQGGDAPPVGQPLEIEDGETTVPIARDELGMAIGGVRNPLVDVPVAVVTGDPPPGVEHSRSEGLDVCALFGQTIPLDRAALLALYGSAESYLASFRSATGDVVGAGFLLPEDGNALMAEAEANLVLFDEIG